MKIASAIILAQFMFTTNPKPQLDQALAFQLRGARTVISRDERGLWNGWDNTSGVKIECQGQTNAATVQSNLAQVVDNLNKR